MPVLYVCSLLQTGGSNPSYTMLARETTTWIMRASIRTSEMKSRLHANEDMVASNMPRLVEKYALQDIYTIDVTSLAFCRNPVANEHSTETATSTTAVSRLAFTTEDPARKNNLRVWD